MLDVALQREKLPEVSTNNIRSKAQRNKVQRPLKPVKAQRKMRNLIFLNSEAQCNYRNELFDSVEDQCNCGTAFLYLVKAQPNFYNWNLTTKCKCRIFFCDFRQKRINTLLKKANIYQYYDQNGTTLSSIDKIALLTEKKLKAQRN